MKRNNPQNINTKTYWNGIYGSEEKRQGYADTGTDQAVHGMQTTKRFSRALQEVKADDRFLDIGCGVGVMTKLVKDSYPLSEVWGVDISDQAIEDNKKERSDITYQQGYIGDLKDIPTNYFNVVFSGETLEHLDEPSTLLSEAYAFLKEGGKLIITTPLQDAIQSPEHTWFFTQGDVEQLYLNAGFKRIEFVYLPDLEHLLVIFAIGYK